MKIGDKYKIEENGKTLTGTITGIFDNGITVNWNDGSQTFEEKPEPKVEK